MFPLGQYSERRLNGRKYCSINASTKMSLNVMHQNFQNQFTDNLLAQTSPVISKRFAVYRNNVFVSLVDALKSRFPAVQNAVGEEFFTALARDYAGSNPPTSPMMMYYGDNFPDYLRNFTPLADYPWIGDLAYLECKITKSYHARDERALDLERLKVLKADELYELRFVFHPSFHMIESRFPVFTIWQMNTGQTEITTIDNKSSETALIFRPDLTVTIEPMTTTGGIFFSALKNDSTLGDAVATALDYDEEFDLSSHLQILVANRIVINLIRN